MTTLNATQEISEPQGRRKPTYAELEEAVLLDLVDIILQEGRAVLDAADATTAPLPSQPEPTSAPLD